MIRSLFRHAFCRRRVRRSDAAVPTKGVRNPGRRRWTPALRPTASIPQGSQRVGEGTSTTNHHALVMERRRQ